MLSSVGIIDGEQMRILEDSGVEDIKPCAIKNKYNPYNSVHFLTRPDHWPRYKPLL